MKTLFSILYLISFIVFLVGCGEKDVYDLMEEDRQREFERRQSLTQEERDAEDLAIQQEKEQKKREYEEEQKQREEQEKWDLENTDLIYYDVSRYSANGKFIVEGKFYLTPTSTYKLEQHNFENRGYNNQFAEDVKGFVADASFFNGFPPDGKFDIYYVKWKKGSRDEAISVGRAYRNISRGW